MTLSKKIFTKLGYYLLLAIPGLVVLFQVLFRQHIFSDGDAVLQLYPALDFLRESMQKGDSFIWNPHVLTGFVTAAGLMGGFFSKLNQVVYQLVSVSYGYAWLTFFSYWLTSVFTFELARKIGLSKFPSLFAGFVAPWLMANALWAGNMTVTSGLFLLPFLLYIFSVFDEQKG